MKTLKALKKHVLIVATLAVAVATLATVAHAEPINAPQGQAQVTAPAAQPDTTGNAPAKAPIVLNGQQQISPDEVAKNSNFCVWETRWVCNYYGFCAWQTVYICY